MGLVGRENSFLIHNVRNPSATVISRLAKVRPEESGQPYERLSHLIEDFIELNDFDDRCLDILKDLRPRVALHVMGFTAKNTFVVGGRNPSASLMSRVSQAQKIF